MIVKWQAPDDVLAARAEGSELPMSQLFLQLLFSFLNIFKNF